MRNYICAHRRKGIIYNTALHAFDAMKKGAEYFGCPLKEVEVSLNEMSIPPHHKKTEYRYRYSGEQGYKIDRDMFHKNQQQLVLEYLSSGRVMTKTIARRMLSVKCIYSVIRELKKSGHKIVYHEGINRKNPGHWALSAA